MKRPACLPLAVACLMAGCTIMDQRKDNDQRDQRIQTKETELAQARGMQAKLVTEGQSLADDLRTRELSVGELTARLQEMQRLNAASLADTQQRREQKAERQKKLSEAAGQVKTIEQDTSSTPAAKARHLEEVRKELRKTLELLAVT